jgi:hypothetical protein
MRQLGHTDSAFTLRAYAHSMSGGAGKRERLKELADGYDPFGETLLGVRTRPLQHCRFSRMGVASQATEPTAASHVLKTGGCRFETGPKGVQIEGSPDQDREKAHVGSGFGA